MFHMRDRRCRATAVAAIYQKARLEELAAYLESLQRTDAGAAP